LKNEVRPRSRLRGCAAGAFFRLYLPAGQPI
jgi:hypothetical protein